MPSSTALHRLLPVPRSITETGGTVRLAPGAAVTVASDSLLPAARLLVTRLARWTGITLAAPVTGPAVPGGVHLAVDAADPAVTAIPAARGVGADGAGPGAERFALTLGPDTIRLTGAAPAGLHRAATTLAALTEQAERDGEALVLPAARVADGPALAWRGLSFDVVRAVFTPDEVLRVVDLLDRYHLNVLHLHLTDDQGWRLEIPARPALTAGAAPGTYFTQEQYRAIVAYAAERFVTVVPEIDMPGHSAAAIAAYPELTTSGVASPVPADPLEAMARLAAGDLVPQYLDPAKDAVWAFVDDVVASVAALTPGAFLHIGGDEPFGMPHDLHAAFVDRARAVVRAHGKQPVGWQEAVRADGTAPGELLQLWIDDTIPPPGDDSPLLAMIPPPVAEMITATLAGSAADPRRLADKRARVLMSRTGRAYLDTPYAETPRDPGAEARRARLGHPGYPAVTIEESATAPIPGIDEATDLDVVGFEAAVWCETVTDADDLSFLLLPRLAGLAQRAWAPGAARAWDDLRVRLGAQAPAWRRDGHAYFPAPSVDWR
jgi:hexosaminidase